MSIFGSIGKGLGGGLAAITAAPLALGSLAFAGPIAQMMGGNKERQNAVDLAQRGSDASNPLTQPQRFGMQDQLKTMFTPEGANSFMQNDPEIQATKGMIGDWAQANFAKSGNMPLTAITGSNQLAATMGQQFNQRIQDLLVGGGFTQNNNYGGMPFSAAQAPSLTGTQTQLTGIGNLLGMIPGVGQLFGGGGGGGGGGLSGLTGMGIG